MRNIFRLGLLCTLLLGCRDELVYTIPTEEGYQYNIVSELSPSNIVDLRLSENVAIGRKLENIERDDAIVSFSGDDVPGGVLPMIYNTTSEKYQLVREDFRVSGGSKYSITIAIPSENMDTIRASTQIPKAVGFSAEFISSRKIPIDDIYSHHEIDVNITFGRPETRPAYFRFVPYRLESIVTINNGGIDVVNFGTKSLLEVIEVQAGANAVEYFSHKEGVTIDESRLNKSRIRLRLRTIKPLKDGASVLLQDGSDRILRLRLELLTISKDLYEFDRFVDVVNQGVNVPFQNREVSNISNATGVFGGHNRTITFLELL